MRITSAGFQFLLHSPHEQIWMLLLQYLHMAEVRQLPVSGLSLWFLIGKTNGCCWSPKLPPYALNNGTRTSLLNRKPQPYPTDYVRRSSRLRYDQTKEGDISSSENNIYWFLMCSAAKKQPPVRPVTCTEVLSYSAVHYTHLLFASSAYCSWYFGQSFNEKSNRNNRNLFWRVCYSGN